MEKIEALTDDERKELQQALMRSVLSSLALGAIIFFALAYQSLPAPLLTVVLFIIAYYWHKLGRRIKHQGQGQKIQGTGKIIRKLDLMRWHFILCELDKKRWIPLRHKRDDFDQLKKGQTIELAFGRISYHLFSIDNKS
jgi:hypothetical protein